MTTATFYRAGEIEINHDGRAVVVPISQLAHDADLREVVAQCLQCIGQPVTVPSTGPRVPRPRNSRMHGIAQ